MDRISVERNEKIYACCVEPYPDVTFTIHMTRRYGRVYVGVCERVRGCVCRHAYKLVSVLC